MRISLQATAGPNEGHVVTFDHHDSFVVGRSVRSTLRLPKKDLYLSRYHFLLEVNPPLCRVMDLGSRNGTFVNDQRVTRADLKNGDTLKAGHTVFKILVETETSRTMTHEPAAKPGTRDSTLSAVPKSGLPSTGSAHALPQFPGYQLIQEVGRGGMGTVYEATRLADNSVVAIKQICPTLVPTQKQIHRFNREMEILRSLNHPNVVRFLEAGEMSGTLWFAMEYVPGSDASKRVKEQGPFSVASGVKIAIRLLKGLAHAHDKGIVHRDIKPANVLLAKRPDSSIEVKLADFGLARVYDESQLSGLTLTGDIGGTPAYMSPEQVMDFRNVGPASDLYGVSATLYYLITGEHIFEMPKDSLNVIGMVLDEEPIPITQRRKEIPQALADVIHHGLAKDPENRFSNAHVFVRELQTVCP